VSLYRVEIADGHDEKLVAGQAQLLSERGAIPLAEGDPVVHDPHCLGGESQRVAQVARRGLGHRHVGGAPARRPAERDAPATALRVVSPTVHRDDVPAPDAARGDRTIDSHPELVAVCHLDAVRAKDVGDLASARGIERTTQDVALRREATLAKLRGEPACMTRGTQREHLVAAPP
jgi:hypothetical protein